VGEKAKCSDLSLCQDLKEDRQEERHQCVEFAQGVHKKERRSQKSPQTLLLQGGKIMKVKQSKCLNPIEEENGGGRNPNRSVGTEKKKSWYKAGSL